MDKYGQGIWPYIECNGVAHGAEDRRTALAAELEICQLSPVHSRRELTIERDKPCGRSQKTQTCIRSGFHRP